jgi:hypothetical protein
METVRSSVGALSPATGTRDRRVFWLDDRHGMTACAIGAIPGLGRKPLPVPGSRRRPGGILRL